MSHMILKPIIPKQNGITASTFGSFRVSLSLGVEVISPEVYAPVKGSEHPHKIKTLPGENESNR